MRNLARPLVPMPIAAMPRLLWKRQRNSWPANTTFWPPTRKNKTQQSAYAARPVSGGAVFVTIAQETCDGTPRFRRPARDRRHAAAQSRPGAADFLRGFGGGNPGFNEGK